MSLRIVSPKACVLAAALILTLGTSSLLPGAEVKKPQVPSYGSVQPPNPFHIFSPCPPAICYANWDGLADPAAGNTDFTPAGIREQFSFTTGNAIDWSCSPDGEYCRADYNSGTFTATGPAGTFTGTITSGYATDAPLGWDILVSFTGQWSNGQRMTGTAEEHYSDEFQIPDSTLTMSPAH